MLTCNKSLPLTVHKSSVRSVRMGRRRALLWTCTHLIILDCPSLGNECPLGKRPDGHATGPCGRRKSGRIINGTEVNLPYKYPQMGMIWWNGCFSSGGICYQYAGPICGTKVNHCGVYRTRALRVTCNVHKFGNVIGAYLSWSKFCFYSLTIGVMPGTFMTENLVMVSKFFISFCDSVALLCEGHTSQSPTL